MEWLEALQNGKFPYNTCELTLGRSLGLTMPSIITLLNGTKDFFPPFWRDGKPYRITSNLHGSTLDRPINFRGMNASPGLPGRHPLISNLRIRIRLLTAISDVTSRIGHPTNSVIPLLPLDYQEHPLRRTLPNRVISFMKHV